MTPQQIVILALRVSIMLTVFGYGLQASGEDILYVLRRPRVLILSFASMFIVMPLFAILVTRIFSFDRAVVIALIAFSISPIPPLLPKKVTKSVTPKGVAKSAGIASYGLGLMVTAATFAIVFIPVATDLIGKYFDRPFAMSPAAVAKLVALSILMPLALGMLIRRFAPSLAERIAGPAVHIAGIILLIGVLCILVVALPAAWSLVGNGTILVFIAFVIVGLAVGTLLGGPGRDEKVTLALCTACRHPALALAIATANFGKDRNIISAILLYLVVNALVTIPYVAWQRKKA